MINTYTIIISILVGIVLFFIYYNMTDANDTLQYTLSNIVNRTQQKSKQNKDNIKSVINKKLKEKIKNNKVRQKLMRNENLLENEHNYDNDIEKYNLGSIKYSNTNDEDIDDKRIHKKINNSKYIIPVNDELYNNNNNLIKYHKGNTNDPRMIIKTHDNLDCNAKKRYDLLIEDDYDSMDIFNNNCVLPASSYEQTTNNPNISKELLEENPDFYKDIQSTL